MTAFTQCDLTFLCRQRWEDLADTDASSIRYCDSCRKGVFAVRTHVQLDAASAVGRCVALMNDNDIIGFIGETTMDWMEEASETIAVRTHRAPDTKTFERLRMAFPKVAWTEEGFSAGAWIVIGSFTPLVAESLQTDIRSQFPEFDIQRSSTTSQATRPDREKQ